MPPCESRSLAAGTNASNWCPGTPAAAKLAVEHGPDGDDDEEELWVTVADEAAPEEPADLEWLEMALRAVIDGLDRRSGLRRHAPHRRHPQRLLAARCRRQAEVSYGAHPMGMRARAATRGRPAQLIPPQPRPLTTDGCRLWRLDHRDVLDFPSGYDESVKLW